MHKDSLKGAQKYALPKFRHLLFVSQCAYNYTSASILKQNDANMQAFIDESLDNVLPTKYLKLHKREWDSTKKVFSQMLSPFCYQRKS